MESTIGVPEGHFHFAGLFSVQERCGEAECDSTIRKAGDDGGCGVVRTLCA